MGIDLDDRQLALVLDEAVAIARSREPLPELWTRRVKRLGELGIRTYVAALGAALLSKATDERVDALAQDVAAGPRGYSLRKAAEFLAVHNEGRFHMGASGRWPLNNRPFLGGPARIDEFTKISGRAKPSYELFRDCLVDLNRLSRREALEAFAAWLRVRMAVQQAELEAGRRALAIETTLDASALVEVAERFVREDPEGGRRAQAFVAAALDCAFDDVVLQPINNPKPGDVRVRRAGRLTLISEVKQLPVGEHTALELAKEARDLDVSLALLVVVADRHEPLDRDRVRRRALHDHGVMVEAAESVRELLGLVAVLSATPVAELVQALPGRYAARMREHEVSEAAQRRWAQQIDARTGA